MDNFDLLAPVDPSSDSEYSGSEDCSSSCYSSESDFVPWLDHVKDDGSLFYVKLHTNLAHPVDDSVHKTFLHEQSFKEESKSKFNPATKLKKWMKKRRKKASKSFPLKESSKSETSSNPSQNSFSQSKDVFVDVTAAKVASCSQNELSLGETLFGLKLGSLRENYSASEKPSILEIRPDEDIHDVKIGNRLLSVNDINVNMGNLDNVLTSIPIPSKVKLTVMLSFECQANFQLQLSSLKHYDLQHELLGESSIIQHVKSRYQHIPHCLFYLTISNGTFENDDVLYRYPDDDTLLFQLKGMFLTLGHMISDVASPPVLSCSVMVLRDLVHVGFVTEGDNIMLLAFPASVASVTEIQHFSTGLAKFLKYLFSSLQNAFTIGKDDGFLDNFLPLYFEHYLSSICDSQNVTPEPHLIDILPSAHWFPLPNHIKVEIDDILSELESADFGISCDGFYNNRRLYKIFGSCLFYKGYLLCSHLSKNDLLDIHSFLHHNHLLELTGIQPVSQIIIWREIFPSKYQECLIKPDPEFQEYHGRWFLLIVVMYHSILAVLLDDGECCIKHEDYSPPEQFYVEEVENALGIFHDYGIASAVEKMLHLSVFPASSPNSLFKGNSRNSLVSASTRNASTPSSEHSVLHRSSSPSSLIEKNQDQESSFSGDSYEMSSLQNRYRSLSVSAGYLSKSEIKSDQAEYYSEKDKNGQNFSSLPNLYEAGFNSDSICFENSFRMVSNIGKKLFYYLQMDLVEGVFIAPITPNSSLSKSLQKSILNNFYRCCLHMRTIFERSLRNGEITKANIITKYGVNSFLQTANEQGLLFKCDQIDVAKQKSAQTSAHFWVIGRIFFAPEPKVVYVCHHDSTPQDVVEMAFRLGFGLSF